MMNGEIMDAIYQLYPQVVKTVGDDAYDKDGNKFVYDLQAVNKLAANLQAKRQRSAAYILESDPLFFKAQRGEGTMADWEAKVAEIKARYPKV